MIDYSGKIITPGFVDTHVHYPQITMISEYGEQLIGWLNTYTFPTEIKYSNHAYASQEASVFLDQLVKNGTTTALVFATRSPVSVDAFFEQALKRNMRMISGWRWPPDGVLNRSVSHIGSPCCPKVSEISFGHAL